MPYIGYLKYDGQEIVNAARVSKYVENLMPQFGLENCADCDGIEAALDEEYTTPIVDNAPWFDPNNGPTENFYGVYPLSVSGVEDSNRQVAQTELIGNGTSFGRPRVTGKDVRVTALLIGRDSAAVESGMEWLNRALDGPCGGRDDCQGATLEYYSACPPKQDWSGVPRVPVRWDTATFPGEAGLWSPTGDVTVSAFGNPLWNFLTAGASVYRQVLNLIPGQSYRMTFQASAPQGSYAMEVSDVGRRGIDNANMPQVYDFVAPSSSVMLRVYPTDLGTFTPTTGFMSLSDLRVERTSSLGTVLWDDYRNDYTVSSGWVMNNLTGLTETAERTPSGITFIWRASGAGPTIPAGTMFSQAFRGFTPGKKYRSTAWLTMDEVTATYNMDFKPLGGQEDLFVDYSEEFGLHQFVSEWTADDATQEFGWVANVSQVTPTNPNLNVGLQYLFIEEITDPLEIEDPNPGVNYERVLYQVVATGGPTVEEYFNTKCGAMVRVSFSLRAGVPQQFTPSIVIGGALGGNAYPTPQVDCVNGGPVRHNFALNPNVATNISGWSGMGGTATRAVTANVTPFPPGYATVISFTGTERGIAYSFVPSLPVSLGAAFTASMYIQATTAAAYNMSLAFTSSVATANTISWSSQIDVPANTWTRISVTGPAPLEGTITDIVVSVRTQDPILLLRADALLVEDSLLLGEYFDGATNGGTWLGTANASASLYQPQPARIIVDPDCPPLPSPPLPPTIDEECVTAPGAWRRYVLPVPANAVPSYSRALPVITLESGMEAARQIRMRVYPDPTGTADMTQINPCSYEGEIIVSYMPPFSVMTVDAIERRAWVEGPTIDRQTVTQLMYGSDGGPVEWPSMTCGVPYLFTVDVDAADDISDLDVTLALGVQV